MSSAKIAAIEAPAPQRAPLSLRQWQLFAIFAVEAVAIAMINRPVDLSFERFAFFDYGTNLTLQALTAQGLSPAVDFGYQYGLLAVLIGKEWFRCFGLTPAAYQWAMLAGALLFAWALARIFAGRRIGAAGVALLVLSFGFAFQSTYPNMAHCVEAVLIAHALAAQSRGSWRAALAIATAAAFAKPSMAYVYGAILLILIVLEPRRRGGTTRDFLAAIAPAAIVFVALTAILSAVYGPRSMLLTILPIEGASDYRALHYGFLGPGRYLWYPGKGLAAWLLDVPGWWMTTTLFLFAAAVVQAANYARTKTLTPGGEVILTCAILHISFIVLFFGPSVSWYYYSYLLAIGCALAAETGLGWRRAAWVLCAFAGAAWYTPANAALAGWKSSLPSSETAGLWSSLGEANEWKQVVEQARQRKMVVVDIMGGVEVMYPEFGPPTNLWVLPGITTREELARTVARLKDADGYVISGADRNLHSWVPEPPEITEARNAFDLEWQGQFFEVYRRRDAKEGRPPFVRP